MTTDAKQPDSTQGGLQGMLAALMGAHSAEALDQCLVSVAERVQWVVSASVYRLEAGRRILKRTASSGVPKSLVSHTQMLTPQDQNAWRAFATQTALWANMGHMADGPDQLPQGAMRAGMSHAGLLPLTAHGTPWGLVTLGLSGEPAAEDARQLELLVALAGAQDVARRQAERADGLQLLLEESTRAAAPAPVEVTSVLNEVGGQVAGELAELAWRQRTAALALPGKGAVGNKRLALLRSVDELEQIAVRLGRLRPEQVQQASAVDLSQLLQGLQIIRGGEVSGEVQLELDSGLAKVLVDARWLRDCLERLLGRARATLPTEEVLRVRLRSTTPERTGNGLIARREYLQLVVDREGVAPSDIGQVPRSLMLLLLGLRTLADAHGGAVELVSKGGEMRLYLPTCSSSVDAAPAQQPEGDGKLVWVVDDEDAILEFTEMVLGARGYRVVTFAFGDDVLDATLDPDQPQPDLIILDYVLPTKSGAELLLQLRHRGLESPVLWASGVTPEAAGLGASESLSFLRKPFRVQELVEAAQLLLEPKI